MINRCVLLSLAAGIAAAPVIASAQQAPRSQFPDPQIYSEELTPGQIQRAQDREPAPADEPKARPPAKKKAAAATPTRAVACSGAFAKNSSHLKLATVFKSENVTFTEVDGPNDTKVMASVLFPKDPKRRLEVWWENEAARSGIFLIVINGQSAWTTPRSVRLGLQLAALDRLNGKPFKLRGFDKNDTAPATDWQGGKLASLPGGCKIGVTLHADPKSPQEARSEVSGTTEFASDSKQMRAVKPAVSEIILGY